MKAVFIEWPFWCRTKPEVIINTFRSWGIRDLWYSTLPVDIRPGLAHPDTAKFPGFNIIDCIEEVRLTSLPLTYLHKLAAVFFCSFMHCVNLGDRVANRFFDIHM